MKCTSISIFVVFLFTPTGQSRRLPSTVGLCSRFLLTGEFLLSLQAVLEGLVGISLWLWESDLWHFWTWVSNLYIKSNWWKYCSDEIFPRFPGTWEKMKRDVFPGIVADVIMGDFVCYFFMSNVTQWHHLGELCCWCTVQPLKVQANFLSHRLSSSSPLPPPSWTLLLRSTFFFLPFPFNF